MRHPCTNGGPDNPWETPLVYWEPKWEILSDGKPVSAMVNTEWTATDRRGQWRSIPSHRTSGILPFCRSYAMSEQKSLRNLKMFLSNPYSGRISISLSQMLMVQGGEAILEFLSSLFRRCQRVFFKLVLKRSARTHLDESARWRSPKEIACQMVWRTVPHA